MSHKLKAGMLVVNKIDNKRHELYLIVSICGNHIEYYYTTSINHNKFFVRFSLNNFINFCRV